MKNLFFIFVLGFISVSQAQESNTTSNKPGSNYHFDRIAQCSKTTVKDQCKTSTCWSFSTLAMFESELLRNGQGEYDLSEMFVARWANVEKAITYIRMNGHHQFDQGGEGHDIPYIVSKYGIVPEEVYSGLKDGKTKHNHNELISVLKSYVETIAKKEPTTLTKDWIKGFEGILDAYLGPVPSEFVYKGKKYTPKSFAESLKINFDDYVVLTSFTHHPFYKSFAIEVPDNWAMATAVNVPLDELVENMKNCVNKGISMAWSADVSEKGFAYREGIALVPLHDSLIQKKGQDSKQFNDAGSVKISNVFEQPCEQLKITPELRQDAFDQQFTTDDHGMQITGLYKETTTGISYFEVKNSWGTTNPLNGYFMASEPYIRYKTISIMMHKDGLSKETKRKIGL